MFFDLNQMWILSNTFDIYNIIRKCIYFIKHTQLKVECLIWWTNEWTDEQTIFRQKVTSIKNAACKQEWFLFILFLILFLLFFWGFWLNIVLRGKTSWWLRRTTHFPSIGQPYKHCQANLRKYDMKPLPFTEKDKLYVMPNSWSM